MEFFYTGPSLRKTCSSQQIFKEIFCSFTGMLRNSVGFNSDITTSQRFYTYQYAKKKGPKLLLPWKLNFPSTPLSVPTSGVW